MKALGDIKSTHWGKGGDALKCRCTEFPRRASSGSHTPPALARVSEIALIIYL